MRRQDKPKIKATPAGSEFLKEVRHVPIIYDIEEGDPLTFHVVTLYDLDDLSRSWGRLKLSTGQLLDAVRPAIKRWLMKHPKEVDDLLRSPGDYSGFVMWLALSVLKFDPEQAAAIREFIVKRVIRTVTYSGQEALHERLGYTHEKLKKRDYSPSPGHKIGPNPYSDLESELYTHVVENVLRETRVIVSNVLGYLRTAIRNRLNDLHDQAASRLALVAPSPVLDEQGEEEGADAALSAVALSRLAEDARAEQEGVDAERYTELLKPFSPRERQLAVLLMQDRSPAEAAQEMGVRPQTINTLLRRMGKKIVPAVA